MGVAARLTRGLKRFELLKQRDVEENYRRAANSPVINSVISRAQQQGVTSPSPATKSRLQRHFPLPTHKAAGF